MTSSSDRAKEAIRHLLDAGSSLSKMSRRELEEAARTLVRNATPTKERIGDALEELRAQSRRGADFVSDMVQSELKRELDAAGRRRRAELADLFERVAGVFGEFRVREPAQNGTNGHGPTAETPKKAAPKKAAPKKASPKKASPKKASPKKSTPKKAAPKKSPPKKAPAKKSPAKKAPAKKVAAKKAPAKKAPAKKATAARATAQKRA